MNAVQTDLQLSILRKLSATLLDHSDVVVSGLAATFIELDSHLSAGGTPPEAWREGPDAPAEGYGWTGWEAETDLGNDDDREDVYCLTITDPDGEEYATIVHRTCGGRHPLDGDVAASKVRRADRIVDALNGANR